MQVERPLEISPSPRTDHSVFKVIEKFSGHVAVVLLFVAVAAIGALAISLMHFAVPAWDDLIRASEPAEIGWWHYVYGIVYLHWQGRWVSCGLESAILPKVDLTQYYSLLIGAVAIIDAIGAYLLVRRFTPQSSKLNSLAITACLLALIWAGMPSPAESVYWFVGAVENTMVLSLAIMLVLAVMNVSRHPRPNVILIGLLCIAAVILCGFHELYGSMLCLALMAGALWTIISRQPGRFTWIAITIAAVIGLAIVVMAPGNSQRLISDGGHHGGQLGRAIQIMMSQVRHFVRLWILDPKLLTATAWVAFSPALRSPADRSQSTSRHQLTLTMTMGCVLLWLSMLAIGFFAPSWAFGEYMPPRTLTGVYIVFVIGWLINVKLVCQLISIPASIPTRTLSSLAASGLAVSLLLVGNGKSAFNELRHTIPSWHESVETRFAQLQQSTGKDAIVTQLNKLPNPSILPGGEVVNDTGDYRNWSTVSFFKLRSLRLISQSGAITPAPIKPTRPPGLSSGS